MGDKVWYRHNGSDRFGFIFELSGEGMAVIGYGSGGGWTFKVNIARDPNPASPSDYMWRWYE